MPFLNCCVALCVSSSRRTPNLQFFRLPQERERRDEWLELIRNERLTREQISQWTQICSLHFADGNGSAEHSRPTLFPWSPEWADVISKYNEALTHSVNKGEGPVITPLPLLTPQTTGVDIPGGRSSPSPGVSAETGGRDDSQHTMTLHNPARKGRKRLRIVLDESDSEDEDAGMQYEGSKEKTRTGNLMMSVDSVEQSPLLERKVSLPGTIGMGAVRGDGVMIPMGAGTGKNLHEKAFFSPYHSSQLLSKLADLWRLGRMCDAVLCVGYTVRIKAHKLVLSAMSSVLMNLASKTDGAILELQLPADVNVDAVQKFLTFLYEGVLYISATTVQDIQRLATLFKVDSVLGYCQTFLMTNGGQTQQPPTFTEDPATRMSPVLAHVQAPGQSVPWMNISMAAGQGGGVKPVPAGLPIAVTGSPGPIFMLSPNSKVSATDLAQQSPLLRHQPTVEEEPLHGQQMESIQPRVQDKRIQELRGTWKKQRGTQSYSGTSEDRVNSLTSTSASLDFGMGALHAGNSGTLRVTDSPYSNMDHPDLAHVKIEPEDSATESGEESISVQFGVEGSEGMMDPPEGTGVPRARLSRPGVRDHTTSLEMNSDPHALTQQMRNAMPKTGIMYENLPIPDGFLSESSPEQQRRYMASLLERTQISVIPENQRQYRCLFCPSSFVKAKSCVVHVVETHQIQAKDVLKYVSIERKGSIKPKEKCELCEYKVNKSQDHLHYHKYFKHGVALPEGYQVYKCEICGKESPSKYNWRTHMENCHVKGKCCEVCEQTFSSRTELASHYRLYHSGKKSPVPRKLRKHNKGESISGQQNFLHVFKCPECSYESFSRDDLAGHVSCAHEKTMDCLSLESEDIEGEERLGDLEEEEEKLEMMIGEEKEDTLIPVIKSENIQEDPVVKEDSMCAEETSRISINHSDYECESPENVPKVDN